MPLLRALSSNRLAWLRYSSSARESAICMPRALRKVFAMPPPMKIPSTLSRSLLIISNFSDSLAPPTTAANGRSGLLTASSRCLCSFSTRRPATLISQCFVTPTVDAKSRCASAKSSMTKISATEARFLANSSSFFSSRSGSFRRTFSRSATVPMPMVSTTFSTFGPVLSATNVTTSFISSDIAAATGARDTGCGPSSLKRSMCPITSTLAPL
mmetsp:Transcript_29295/g.40839  ORF Transcript_29295/g.40839 Transcript_29295/m.40839 type:complete len:213 (-) Transcript_29295:393-1031(-)